MCQQPCQDFPTFAELFVTFEKFISLIKHAISAESDAAKDNATVSEPTKKKAIEAKVDKLRGEEIRLTALDHPGSSRSPPFNKIPASKSGPSKVKNTQSKATQMRHNSSTQRLEGNEDIDDDVRNESDSCLVPFHESCCVLVFFFGRGGCWKIAKIRPGRMGQLSFQADDSSAGSFHLMGSHLFSSDENLKFSGTRSTGK